mgnify:CR=1 FL=1
MDKIAHEEGKWVHAPEDELIILKTAIFESLFSYISLVLEDAELVNHAEIGPEVIIQAMLKRTELELIDALVTVYNKRKTDAAH